MCLSPARYYVTMDILRRVLEDYFGYTTTFVMNVTDVDDKIIRRARLSHLLQQYLARTPDTRQVPPCLCSPLPQPSAGLCCWHTERCLSLGGPHSRLTWQSDHRLGQSQVLIIEIGKCSGLSTQVVQDAEAALVQSEARQRAQVQEVEATLQGEGQVRRWKPLEHTAHVHPSVLAARCISSTRVMC